MITFFFRDVEISTDLCILFIFTFWLAIYSGSEVDFYRFLNNYITVKIVQSRSTCPYDIDIFKLCPTRLQMIHILEPRHYMSIKKSFFMSIKKSFFLLDMRLYNLWLHSNWNVRPKRLVQTTCTCLIDCA